MSLPPDGGPRLQWQFYALLIAIACGGMVGRILAVNSVDRSGGYEQALVGRKLLEERLKLERQGVPPREAEARAKAREAEWREQLRQQRPFLSANDRSRWATVRSLVEHGTYAIDEIVHQPGWDTIDMVRHRGDPQDDGAPGDFQLYSSKPPLMATLMAVPYWLIYHTTGASLATHPYEIGRALLILFNVLPLAVLFVLVARFAERFGQTSWGRLFVVAAACFGTFLSTFAVTANNHTWGAVSAAIALHCAWRIWYDGQRSWRHFACGGFFAAFTVTCELPALSFFVLLTAGLLWKAPRPTLLAWLPAALIVAAAHFSVTWIAHGTLKIPYMQRGETEEDNWYKFSYVRADGKVVRSYWDDPQGVDAGEPSALKYAFHATLGHHGVFSLAPIWLLCVPGLVWLASRRGPYQLRDLALFIALISLVCLAFYLSRPQLDRNYGGTTSGLRWMFWFAPMWLMARLPAADRLADCRWGRGLCLVLLAWSVMSVAYPTWNPWSAPWLMSFWEHVGGKA